LKFIHEKSEGHDALLYRHPDSDIEPAGLATTTRGGSPQADIVN
jgi:hypothetical protein